MKRFDFLVCYDMADTKRLRKVAKVLERESIRIQKSQFFYLGATQDDIVDLVDELNTIIDKEEDDIRIYKVDKLSSIHLKSGVNLKQPNLI
jgi:CRISPR-associated protein Cas2